ncbi:MAG TPA: hypothetical protein VD706_01045 [Candidatus Saccharimonadales bacterium]|nr:hypothetical protein [Candidatus Saccharimonadales bacterium]
MPLKNFRIFFISLVTAFVLMVVKFLLHELGWEAMEQGSLHNSVAAGAFFVIGFLLSATIVDYKESERIPSEFASILENMYEDAKSTHGAYPKFDLERFRKELQEIGVKFKKDVRNKTHDARHEVHKLGASFAEMEKAGVPPNFIVKMKQQQAQLAKSLFRVNYIQNIRFIPSASILAWSIVVVATLLLLFTEVTPFYGGMVIMAIIYFILVYMLLLIRVISTPFHSAGKTQDDVSLFLVGEAINYLRKQKSIK